jgi:hypothetical protein
MRIESHMNDADIQRFFDTYVGQANPTAVSNRIIRALQSHLKGKNLNGGDKEVDLLHRFYLAMH